MDSDNVAGSLAAVLDVAPLTWTALAACFVSGGLVGLERQLRGKPVGVRTNILICLGTYVFVAMSLASATTMTDPTRMLGQIATGIGFLGAGVMLTRGGTVVGATSAADIWMLAAIGVVIAVESPALGVKLAVLTVIILVGLDRVGTIVGWGQPRGDSDASGRDAGPR